MRFYILYINNISINIKIFREIETLLKHTHTHTSYKQTLAVVHIYAENKKVLPRYMCISIFIVRK